MANGQTVGLKVRQMADGRELPTAALVDAPNALFLPIARVFPEVEMERVSLADLMRYINAELPLHEQLQTARQNIRSLTSHSTSQQQQLGQVQRMLDNIMERLQTLEAHGSPHAGVAGRLRYGLVNNAGAKQGTEESVAFTSIPKTVAIRFPAPAVEHLRWYVEFPANVMLTHIYNDALQRRDEITAWTEDPVARRYTSNPLSPHFTGDYSITVVAAQPQPGG